MCRFIRAAIIHIDVDARLIMYGGLTHEDSTYVRGEFDCKEKDAAFVSTFPYTEAGKVRIQHGDTSLIVVPGSTLEFYALVRTMVCMGLSNMDTLGFLQMMLSVRYDQMHELATTIDYSKPEEYGHVPETERKYLASVRKFLFLLMSPAWFHYSKEALFTEAVKLDEGRKVDIWNDHYLFDYTDIHLPELVMAPKRDVNITNHPVIINVLEHNEPAKEFFVSLFENGNALYSELNGLRHTEKQKYFDLIRAVQKSEWFSYYVKTLDKAAIVK